MSLNQYLDNQEARITIALQVAREMQEELQDGELDAAIAAMDEPEAKRRKVVSPEEYRGDYDPPYEKPKEYEV